MPTDTPRIAVFLVIFAANIHAAETVPVPPEELKRQMTDRISTAIGDAERLALRISFEDPDHAVKAAETLGTAFRQAHSKWHDLSTARPSEYDKMKDSVRQALTSLQTAVFNTSSRYSEERSMQNDRVRQAVGDMGRMVDDLSYRIASSAGDSHDGLRQALVRIERHQRDLTDRLDQLVSTSGNRWADMRRTIESRIQDANDIYTEAIHSASLIPQKGGQT